MSLEKINRFTSHSLLDLDPFFTFPINTSLSSTNQIDFAHFTSNLTKKQNNAKGKKQKQKMHSTNQSKCAEEKQKTEEKYPLPNAFCCLLAASSSNLKAI